MKTKIFIFTIALFSLFIIFGCREPSAPVIPDGMGTFSLIISDNGGRTILPDTTRTNYRYKITLYQAGTNHEVETIDGTYEQVRVHHFILAAGEYDLLAIAYLTDFGSGKPAASVRLEGSDRIVIASGTGASRTISFSVSTGAITSGGQGKFSWNIILPHDIDNAKMIIKSLAEDGSEQTIVLIENSGASQRTSSDIMLDSGYYQITFELEQNTNHEKFFWHEVLHIYDNMESYFPAHSQAHEFPDDFNIKKYTITFEYNDGTGKTARQTRIINTVADEPNDAQRTGYRFDGWFNKADDTVWSFTTPVAANVTLFAEWTPIFDNQTAPAAITVDGAENGVLKIGAVLNVITSGIKAGNGDVTSFPGLVYQWLADGHPFSYTASSPAYTVTGEVVNMVITCKVTQTSPEIDGALTAEIKDNPKVPYTITLNPIYHTDPENGDIKDAISADKALGHPGDTVELSYTLDCYAGINRIVFNHNIQAVSESMTIPVTPVIKTGTVTYTINANHAAENGVITIEARFQHTNKTFVEIFFTAPEPASILYAGSSGETTFTNTISTAHPGVNPVKYTITFQNHNAPHHVADINEDTGAVIIHRAGEITVTAKIAEDENYAETEKSYSLTIDPIPLSWNTAGKVNAKPYDGTTDAAIAAGGNPGLIGVLASETSDVTVKQGTVLFNSANVIGNEEIVNVTASEWDVEGALVYNYIKPAMQPAFTGAIIYRADGWEADWVDEGNIEDNKTENSITILPANKIPPGANPPPNDQTVEYNIKKDGLGVYLLGTWQTVLTFTGLEPAAEYVIYARTGASQNYNTGTTINECAKIHTDKLELNAVDFVCADLGDVGTYTKSYDNERHAVTVTYRAGITAGQAGAIAVWYIGETNQGLSYNSTQAPVDAGFYDIFVSAAEGALYYAAEHILLGVYRINLREVTVKPDDGQTKIYGENDPVLTHDSAAGSIFKLLTGHRLEGNLRRVPGEAVTDYRINDASQMKVFDTGNNDVTSNYNLLCTAVPNPVNFVILPLQLTWDRGSSKTNAASVNDKPYDAANSAVVKDLPTLSGVFKNYNLNGFILDDTVDVIVTVRFKDIFVGTVDVEAVSWTINDGLQIPNYLAPPDPPIFVPAQITPRPVTVTPRQNQSKTYNGDHHADTDGADPALTFDAASGSLGLAAGDNWSGALTRREGRHSRTAAGLAARIPYEISKGTLGVSRSIGGVTTDISNCYNITVTAGVMFTINPAQSGTAPLPSAYSRTFSSVRLRETPHCAQCGKLVSNGEQDVEYAMALAPNSQPLTTQLGAWRDAPFFGLQYAGNMDILNDPLSLQPTTTYYFFARAKESVNFLLGAQNPLTSGQQIMTASLDTLALEFTPIPGSTSGNNLDVPPGFNLNNLVLNISKGEGKVNEIIITLTNIAGPFAWYLDSTLKAETSNSYSLRSSDFRTTDVGKHRLSVEVYIEGRPYNMEIEFTVQP